jgi:hypothetical protein
MSEPEPRPAPKLAKRLRFQFSLGTLLAVVAAVGLLLGLRTWRGEVVSRTPEAFLAIGLGLFAAGAFLRRWAMAAFGLVLLAGLAWEIFVINPTRAENMVFNREWFRVVDSQTSKPVAGARVRVVSCAASIGTTDTSGDVRLKTYPPSIDGKYRLMDGDYLSTDGKFLPPDYDWFVEVDAPGYAPVRVKYTACYAYEPTLGDIHLVKMHRTRSGP